MMAQKTTRCRSGYSSRDQSEYRRILLSVGPVASTPYLQTPFDSFEDGHSSWTLDMHSFLHFRVEYWDRPMPRLLSHGFAHLSSAAEAGI